MSGEKTVVVHSSVCPDEEELPSAVPTPSLHPAQTSSVSVGADDDDDDDEFAITYVAQKSAPVNIASARSAPQKRLRNSAVEQTSASLDTDAVESKPDDTDHPHDRAEYVRWQARDAARPKKLLIQ
ncbi:hypothetical protein C3747_189g302c [Trypanosoma cruzi]|uniref:Uncharacterized protein n=2 Tax=Trypanosoma cruzi TaxID=5693 RepID=Q4D5D4_TRYCC|nr:hypothetical protein, conserved [Trypanosoma cruzi]EAN87734.1 hypothetical protein, conserved [Trypanosoma cruzi]PWV02201.1 hypothetical protein C3747_189g302c [Trypanosoma cruzi]RNC53097.1 hypothetical protein TcCL_ESM09605 [Trypanosoma cruzi]|eukprot:XP_809585.1 hypothetical protein [Trypanosoma cruzi strain CL Brener]